MKKELNYHDEQNIQNVQKLKELKTTLPPFVSDYFRGIEPKTSTKTRISYAYDIRLFFYFLIQQNPCYKEFKTSDFRLEDLNRLNAKDIEEYLEFLKAYKTTDGYMQSNDERGRHRKLASLRSMFYYLNRHEMISGNPVVLVDMPKLHDKEIIRLDPDEVAELLDLVEHGGDGLSGMKKVYFEKNRLRNLAVFTLLLGTGLRVSECVGLDITDIDFKNGRIKIIRKGGKEDFVYFGNEVEEALLNYIEKEREKVVPVKGHEKALFYSIQNKRLSVRSIENLVSENAKKITTLKHITPHKLRSTFGTSLYRETDDIYLVAEVLGHNDVNTTKKHYAALDEDRKRRASKVVKLREP